MCEITSGPRFPGVGAADGPAPRPLPMRPQHSVLPATPAGGKTRGKPELPEGGPAERSSENCPVGPVLRSCLQMENELNSVRIWRGRQAEALCYSDVN